MRVWPPTRMTWSRVYCFKFRIGERPQAMRTGPCDDVACNIFQFGRVNL